MSRDTVKPGGATANSSLLDHGTLMVAKFNADGKGQWIALTHGQGPLTAANGFADQGEVLIKARQASDLLGATKMDRPEWIDVDKQGWVYCTLTNNSNRGMDKQPARVRHQMTQVIDSYRARFKLATTKGPTGRLGSVF